MRINLPTGLTLLRIALIPLLVVVYFSPLPARNLLCTALFGLAAITDWADGYLARRMGLTSAFGAFLDPVADKLMVAAALVLLVQADPTPLMAVAALVIIGREITISALREWMAQAGNRDGVAVSWVGKLKTTLQMVAILLLLYRDPLLGLPVLMLGQWLLYVAAALTVSSMAHYLRRAWVVLQS